MSPAVVVISFPASGDSNNAILDGKLALGNRERCVKTLPSGELLSANCNPTPQISD
jgi:hypothetical protein